MAEEVQSAAEDGGSKTVTFTAMKPQVFVEAPKANDAVQFYKAAFGAEEGDRTMHPKRKAEQEQPLVLSAELKFGSFSILVSDLADDSVPAEAVGTGFAICLETEDVDAAVAKAVKAGAVAVSEGEAAEGEGARCGGSASKVKDPYGIIWMICSPAKKSAGEEA
ncbi:hypothetical protein NMG60_11034436 [Bertholletia excelsa]